MYYEYWTDKQKYLYWTDNIGKRLTGLKFVLLVGSSFLNAGTLSESFRVSGNLFSVKALLIHFVNSLKQNSEFFNMSTGISPAVALSEGRFFTTFFTVSSERNWKESFLFVLTFCSILSILGYLESLAIICSILSLLLTVSPIHSNYVLKVLAIFCHFQLM